MLLKTVKGCLLWKTESVDEEDGALFRGRLPEWEYVLVVKETDDMMYVLTSLGLGWVFSVYLVKSENSGSDVVEYNQDD